ncbi:MAG: VOC family protein, partial [Pseudomonadota bacterium]
MAIFTHMVVGTNDLERSKNFYNAALGALGLKSVGPMGANGHMWGKDGPEFIVTKPANGLPS